VSSAELRSFTGDKHSGRGAPRGGHSSAFAQLTLVVRPLVVGLVTVRCLIVFVGPPLQCSRLLSRPRPATWSPPLSRGMAGQVGQSGPLSGLDPQQPYSPAAPLTRPPGLDPDGPTFPSPRKLVAEGLDPTEVGTQTKALGTLSVLLANVLVACICYP
jgi:hypothetical protein